MPAEIFGAADRAYVLVPTTVQTAAYAANPSDYVRCNTTGGALTVTLPSAPYDRAVLGAKLVAGTNTLTIVSSGTDVFDIAGGGTSISWSTLDQGVLLQYSLADGVWLQVANYATGGGGGGVSSFNTRTGAVVPVSGDYSFSLITGTATIAQGGTGQTGTVAAFNALSPSTTLGDTLSNDGTNDVRVAGNTTATKKFFTQTGTGSVSALPGWNTIVAADVPTLNQSTTGTAANVTGVVARANGGLGFTTAPVTSTGPTTVTGVTVATALASGITVAASSLAAGQVYEFEAWGVMSTTVDTQTFTFNLDWGGVGGTSLLTWGASNPNSSATVSNVSWSARFKIVANTATSLAVSGTLCMNFFFSSFQQQVTTVANSSSEQFVLGVTPSASAASITCNGFVSERRW